MIIDKVEIKMKKLMVNKHSYASEFDSAELVFDFLAKF